jgi:isoquinoline 1-oxidoreductase beta subunit
MSATSLESAVVFGLSAVLLEELLFKDGAPQASNFNDYPVRGMADIRQIHTKIVASDNPSTGIGEVGVPAASWASGIASRNFGAPG